MTDLRRVMFTGIKCQVLWKLKVKWVKGYLAEVSVNFRLQLYKEGSL